MFRFEPGMRVKVYRNYPYHIEERTYSSNCSYPQLKKETEDGT